MKVSAICFTEYGYEQMKKLKSGLQELECFCKCSSLKEKTGSEFVEASVQDWAREQFEKHSALLFIGAAGIAVRAIAPHVKNKLTDSPVLVMDDAGRFVIPLLSGHMGGANELAEEIARINGAVPAITTSTDIHRAFAADIFAKENNLEIINKAGIAPVSAKALRGEQIVCETPDIRIITGKISPGLRLIESPLYLRPKEYAVGIGCRRGKSKAEIRHVLEKALEEYGIEAGQISAIGSVDIKKDEAGIRELADELKVPFITFSAEELNSIEGDFIESDFVLEKTGTGNVCERSAIALCGGKGMLIVPKSAENGVTVAIARRS